MRETGVAESILEAIRKECTRTHVVKARVRIAEGSGVNADSLQTCWDALMQVEGERCELELEFCARHNQCPQCEWVFPVEECRTECPRCGCTATAPVPGNELELAFFELEEEMPSASGDGRAAPDLPDAGHDRSGADHRPEAPRTAG